MIGSSPQPPVVHFREIDGETLQRNTKVWLESVLDESFDDETSLADLLADGDILDRVSSKIRVVLTKYPEVEPTSPKSHLPEAKHGGKYLPYSNVESFLKLCQKLGLAGVDLFSPSEVVEKKDIRKVCFCIRALSRKARSIAHDLPAFDPASHAPVAMPKEFVENIRGSLSGASSFSGPTNVKDAETPEKVRLSPFSEDEAPSLESLENLDKEQNSSAHDLQDASTSPRNVDSLINPETPPIKERLPLSDEEKGTEAINAANDLDCDSIQSTISSEVVLSHGADGGNSFYPTPTINGRNDDVAQWNIPEMIVYPSSNGKGSKKRRFLVPLVAGGVALVGILIGVFLSQKPREARMYEVKKGDTLAKIARKTHKHKWQELLRLNPWIKNPDVIYPNERLRLHP